MFIGTQFTNVLVAVTREGNREAISNRFESAGYIPHSFDPNSEEQGVLARDSSSMTVLVISKSYLALHRERVEKWLTQNRKTTAIIGIDDDADDTSELARLSDVVLRSSEAAESVSAVTRAVLSYHSRVNDLAEEVKQRTSAIGYIMAGSFVFRTLDEARNLATMLALACPKPDVAAVGLVELLVNAVEHGNLEVGWELKSKLLQEGRWTEEIEYRLKGGYYGKRTARVDFTRFDDHIEVVVEDEGPGFDFAPFLDGTNKKRSLYHGRGILFARDMAFDAIEYFDKGNRVQVRMDHIEHKD